MPPLEGVKDTLGQLRRRSPQPIYCPKCLSPRMRTTQMFGILPQRYVCENCGYEGALVLEKDDESTQPPESDEKSP